MEQATLPGVLTADAIIVALYDHYSRSDWLCFDELRVGTGYGKDAEKRIDFWAIEAIPSKRFRRVAYEIKVSRADFLAELRQPRKRARALLLSNEFYFITPPGLVKDAELPPECGLVEVHDLGFLTFRHAAPWRDSAPPTWQFLAAVVRRARRIV
jgi:hypothetical protein